MKSYPLVFSFRDLIAGNGFVAGVAAVGRVLLVEEDDGDIWMYGVQPGGVAGGDAKQRKVAFSEFKKGYLSVLFDIAADTESFEEFERGVKKFFSEVNESVSREWGQALDAVRRDNVCLSDLLSVKAEEQVPTLSIALLDQQKAKPTVNVFDDYAEAA